MEKVKIKKIEIINFKGIEHLELDFTYPNGNRILDNIIFYGLNGSGKSTVLEALWIALNIYSWSPTTKDKCKEIEEAFIEHYSLGSDWIYNQKNEFSIKLHILKNKETIKTSFIYHKDNGVSYTPETPQSLSNTLPVQYLSAYRLFKPSLVNNAGDWKEIIDIESNSFYDENHSLAIQFFNDYSTVKQYLVNLITDKKLDVITPEKLEILKKIKEAFQIFFPNKVFLEKLTRSEIKQDYKFLIQNEDKTIVDIDQLSSGEREVIAFFTYLATKAMYVSILIIDEPELHLHDKWQSILLYAIHKLFPNTQVFLATHSETIHQSVSESELFELVK